MDQPRQKIRTLDDLLNLNVLDTTKHDITELELSREEVSRLSTEAQVKALFLVSTALTQQDIARATEPLDKRIDLLELRLQAIHEEGLVAKVVAYLNDNVLDNGKLSTLDVLDALASSGAQIVTDPAGFTSVDYQRALDDSSDTT